MTMRFDKPLLADGPEERVRLRYAPAKNQRVLPVLLIGFISPFFYLVLKLVYWPAVEAPGYIVPGTQELHVAAYVPQKHEEYAKPGQEAIVLFPDGEHRDARITDVAKAAERDVPFSDGRNRLGVLVRMDFVEPAKANEPVPSGLPVQIQFPKRWP